MLAAAFYFDAHGSDWKMEIQFSTCQLLAIYREKGILPLIIDLKFHCLK